MRPAHDAREAPDRRRLQCYRVGADRFGWSRHQAPTVPDRRRLADRHGDARLGAGTIPRRRPRRRRLSHVRHRHRRLASAAVIGNAVFEATGIRVHDLPITIGELL
ncbi:hypothetical protein ACFWY9_16010 [Amycolatopsis sp. NPDC059027]|uniref:hypothetical protein n=1 Tax=unclassified Amycolatopsis TaxID=2618356 RepID=UPI0036722C39